MKKISIFLPAIFILVLMSGCLKEDEMKQPFTGFNPVDIGDGWTLSSPSAENIDSLALDKIYKDIYADDDFWMTKSLLVFRNGKLVTESYLKDDIDRTRIDAIWSCTKQVNGIITGIAIDQGYIGDVTDLVSTYLPEYIAKHTDKASLTLENLLMMGSGVAFDNGTQSDIFRKHLTDNSIDYVLGLKLNFQPGTATIKMTVIRRLFQALSRQPPGNQWMNTERRSRLTGWASQITNG
jgi:CubicO group peptidase (beta-lactamase class C family)